jgi:hypothetical protein
MAINMVEIGACSCSPVPTAALTPPTHKPVTQPPAYPPRSSLEHEMWLCWKLPDLGRNRRWPACYVVSERLRPSVIPSSLKFLAATSLPVLKPASPQTQLSHLTFIWQSLDMPLKTMGVAYYTEVWLLEEVINKNEGQRKGNVLVLWPVLVPCLHCHLSLELGQRIHYEPPDATDEARWPSAEAISDHANMSVCHSPSYRAMPMPHMAQLTSLRAAKARHPNNELVTQGHMPPGSAMEIRLREEAISKTKGQHQWGHLLVLQPILVLVLVTCIQMLMMPMQHMVQLASL